MARDAKARLSSPLNALKICRQNASQGLKLPATIDQVYRRVRTRDTTLVKGLGPL